MSAVLEKVTKMGQQLLGSGVSDTISVKSPDDVVVTLAIRSPLCKGMFHEYMVAAIAD
jgi:hypothetical protein